MTDHASAITFAPGDKAGPPVTVERDERTIRLGDLGVARENLRHGQPPDDDIPTLAATLRAAGQLQPLTVRPGRGRKEPPWVALDGRRRRLALDLLLEAGEIDEDYPVRVYVETDPARQAAAVLLTNTAVPVHVADVIAAIGRMLKSRLTVAAIARALGYAEIEIRRLAALSGLPPEAIAALRAGRLTLKQVRLLARLADRAEQSALAQAALDGHGFAEWRIIERLGETRVTTRDRRCGLVDPEAYGAAGGRAEADLFGELAPVLLDPDILTELWLARARGIAAVFEAEGIAVHVTAGPEPDLPEDLEALGYVYGGQLPSEDMARYRAQRDVFTERAEAARLALQTQGADVADLAIVDMVRARLAADQTGCGGRAVTTMVLRPSAEAGVEVCCYAPEEPETDIGPETEAEAPPIEPAWAPPVVETPEPDTEGVNHALHAVRTEVATRGLIRAVADDPAVALSVLLARLFTVLVLGLRTARSESALTVVAAEFDPAGGRVIPSLDGVVRERLDERRAAFQASGDTVMAWIHGLEQEDKMGLLAELTAVSLDVRETRTTQLRTGARAEAAEAAALCDADITRHWTPDAPFLHAHSKGLLIGMLEAMGADARPAGSLRKTELVDWVAEQAASRVWAPAVLSWRASPGDACAGEPEAAAGSDEPDDGEGAYTVTPAGEAALGACAA